MTTTEAKSSHPRTRQQKLKAAMAAAQGHGKASSTEYALVLGMVYVKPGTTFQLATGTTSSQERDFMRLNALKKHLGGVQPIALGYSGDKAHLDKRYSIQRDANAGAVASIIRRTRGKPLKYVLGDYVRFPASYLVKMYGPVISSLLPAMKKAGLITKDTVILLPHAAEAYASGIYDVLAKDSFPFKAVGYVHAKNNPLWVASEAVSPSAYGKSTNTEYVYGSQHVTTPLDVDAPFVRIGL